MSDEVGADVLGLMAKIVSAHIAKNRVAADDLPALIQSVYRPLAHAGTDEAAPQAQGPAAPWKKSVFPEFINCLKDGKKLKMLKRHLKTSFNMMPAEYRAKWGLPSDYPMVSPNHARRRSALAKCLGLGREPAAPVVSVIPAHRARGSKG